MNYFIDFKALEGKQKEPFPISLIRKYTKPTIDIISVGIVSQDNREYYAISKDFNLKEAWNRYDLKETSPAKKYMGFYEERVYWIRENVLKPIFDELCIFELYNHEHYTFTYSNLKKLINKYGKTNKQIIEEINKFIPNGKILNNYYEIESIKNKLYTYHTNHNWLALCWLFETMNNIQAEFQMDVTNLKQELDEIALKMFPDFTLEKAIEILKLHPNIKYPKQSNTHNSLNNAKFNRDLYNFLTKIT